MTPKQKATQLVKRFYGMPHFLGSRHEIAEHIAQQHSIMAVDEILESNPTLIDCDKSELNYKYWVEVKKELEKLDDEEIL
jgi:hypothetical protein